MFIQVKLLNGFKQFLTYSVPTTWPAIPLEGLLVRVPLKEQFVPALVIKQMPVLDEPITFIIKSAHSIEQLPDDQHYQTLIAQLASYYQIEKSVFIKRIYHFIENHEQEEIPLITEREIQAHQITLLTDEQQTVVDFITPAITNHSYCPTLLHGVTASGKTEIYKRLIMHAHAQRKTTILLLPEVTLAVQFQAIMRTQLPAEIIIMPFHSATTLKQKRALWHALMHNQPVLIIGVHLPILLPIVNLGLIIVDEEHEVGYQEKKHPKINSKEAALMRAKLAGIPILLGSATPSITSLYNVKQKGWHFFQLKKRFAGAFPTVKTVLLPDKKQRRSFWISQELEAAIKSRLAKKEQTILFLNRRGFSFFVQCKACSYVFECKNCSVSLTLHENDRLSCHYCGIYKQVPPACPTCKAASSEFIKKGVGTQQLVTILKKLFPQARIERADLEVSSRKKVWQELITDMLNGKIDILVGTQTITKGFHFPGVTLVGIIWADLNLHFPFFNAAETTLQQLIQVAGRAGRQRMESQVIVQTMIDHPIFSYLNEIDYPHFYEYEIELRQQVSYPPFIRLAQIELKHHLAIVLEKEATALVDWLLATDTAKKYNVTILGPAKPPVYKINKLETRTIYLKCTSIGPILHLYNQINHHTYKSFLYFTPNPTN